MVFKVIIINIFKIEDMINMFYRKLYKYQMKILAKKNITNMNNSLENNNRLGREEKEQGNILENIYMETQRK